VTGSKPVPPAAAPLNVSFHIPRVPPGTAELFFFEVPHENQVYSRCERAFSRNRFYSAVSLRKSDICPMPQRRLYDAFV
jgi:hypothetical protein